MISIVTNRGKLRFMLYRETMTAAVLIRFPGRLIRDTCTCITARAEWHVSHETTYLTIYAYPRGELKRQLIGYLCQGQGKRRRFTVDTTRRERYPARQNIRQRPEEVEGRQVPGHWESGLIMGIWDCTMMPFHRLPFMPACA